MIKHDYHLHTEFSYDSRIKGSDLLRKMIKLGFKEIAITEHLDLLPQELSLYGLPSLTKYRDYCKKLRENYQEISLHMGIEIGDYHKVHGFATKLIEGFGFSPILGSVHFLSDHTNVAIPFAQPLSLLQIKDYYMQNLELVKLCDIDILAHLGVYKRYYTEKPDELPVQDIIDEIFTVMIKRNIALEINLSSLRKPYKHVIPEVDMINRYRKIGGKLISLGSDSHLINHVGPIPHFIDELCQGFELPLLT